MYVYIYMYICTYSVYIHIYIYICIGAYLNHPLFGGSHYDPDHGIDLAHDLPEYMIFARVALGIVSGNRLVALETGHLTHLTHEPCSYFHSYYPHDQYMIIL